MSARWGELLTKGGPAPRKGVFEGRGGGFGLSRCRSGAARRGTDGGVRGPSLRRAAQSAKAAGGGSALGLVAGWLGGPRGGGFARLGLGLLAGAFALAVEAVAAGVLAEVDELLGGGAVGGDALGAASLGPSPVRRESLPGKARERSLSGDA